MGDSNITEVGSEMGECLITVLVGVTCSDWFVEKKN